MSKAARVPDNERTAVMLDLVHRRYPAADRLSHVVLEEVAPGTGWAARRWADVLVLGLWPSVGLTLDGYEIKASKADLKRELANLSKHEALAQYCDTWWLVVWDETMLHDGIPESWGLIVTAEDEFGRGLVVKRKATRQTPKPWPKAFTCSLVRNAYEQAPGAAYIARACIEASSRGVATGRSYENTRWRTAVHGIATTVYGEESWKWPPEAHDPEHLLRTVAERLQVAAA